eukprot:Filipodium_phascolosomae@DN2287_c0_g1_i1.p1
MTLLWIIFDGRWKLYKVTASLSGVDSFAKGHPLWGAGWFCGVGYQFQMFPGDNPLPCGAFDRSLRSILTEEGLFLCNQSSGRSRAVETLEEIKVYTTAGGSQPKDYSTAEQPQRKEKKPTSMLITNQRKPHSTILTTRNLEYNPYSTSNLK